jgi:hypothetical protein
MNTENTSGNASREAALKVSRRERPYVGFVTSNGQNALATMNAKLRDRVGLKKSL